MDDLIKRAALDINDSHYAIALTGAGMSTESGIPDFRGPKGVWTTDPGAERKAYERYELFLNNPEKYWQEVMGGEGTHGELYSKMRMVEPNAGHYALAKLYELGLLKCVITQNIDGLHYKAGNKNVIEYHGSVCKARCHACGTRCELEEVSLKILPPLCRCGGSMKMDVVHFNESIPIDIMTNAEREVLHSDLILVCGTSAVVYPFASLLLLAKQNGNTDIKVIEINMEKTQLTENGISDYIIQGRIGEILPRIVDTIVKSA